MTLFRGYGGDLPLMEWLQTKIWPAEARLDDEDVYWGTRLACLEMIRSGTIRFWDMYWHPVAVARAVDDSGLRAAVGLPLIDGLDPARGKEVCADAARTLDELEGSSARRHAVAHAARDLHGQRAVAAVGRAGVGRTRRPGPHPLPRDGRRGDRLCRADG